MSRNKRGEKQERARLERAPISSLSEDPSSLRAEESYAALERLVMHDARVRELLKFDTPDEFTVTDEAIRANRDLLRESKEHSHATERTVIEIGCLALGTVAQLEGEVRQKTMLDIGCGRGRFGEAVARNAKATVTFLDSDPEVLEDISPRAGVKVVADGRDLPFPDESFEKTFSTYSSILWAETPLETVQALNEMLRVTKTTGTAFLFPAFTDTRLRDRVLSARCSMLVDDAPGYTLGMKMRALQDHVLFEALKSMTKAGLISITWGGKVGTGMKTGNQLEQISAIVDKVRPIPHDVFEENLEYAACFFEQ